MASPLVQLSQAPRPIATRTAQTRTQHDPHAPIVDQRSLPVQPLTPGTFYDREPSSSRPRPSPQTPRSFHGRNGRPEPTSGGGEARRALPQPPTTVGLAGGAGPRYILPTSEESVYRGNQGLCRLCPRPNLYRLLCLPAGAPGHEQLHEAARDAAGARRSARGMVCAAPGTAAQARAQVPDGGRAGGVYARVVGSARAREAVAAEGDGEARGADTRAYGPGPTEGAGRGGIGPVMKKMTGRAECE